MQWTKAVKEWKEILTKGKDFREQDILDFHYSDINRSTMIEKKLKIQAIERIKQEKQRNHSFQYLTKHIGRGANSSLKRLHEVDETNNIINTYIDCQNIE